MFATVRKPTAKTKGCGSRIATLTMVFKLAQSAEKHRRRELAYPNIFEHDPGVLWITTARERHIFKLYEKDFVALIDK